MGYKKVECPTTIRERDKVMLNDGTTYTVRHTYHMRSHDRGAKSTHLTLVSTEQPVEVLREYEVKFTDPIWVWRD